MKHLLAIFLLSYFFLSSTTKILAQNVITVTPQLIQLDLAAEKPEAEYFYKNETNQTIELSLSIQDVKELEDRGVPGLVDPKESKNYKYGLASWAKFSTNSLVIMPGETKKVTVFIDSQRLSIGGHYASILAEVKQLDKEGPVKLRAILTSLLFVRQGGGHETESAIIYELKNTASFLEFPRLLSFRLNNTGNIDLTPYGRIDIVGPFGKEVGFGIINEDSLITLPESIRKYEVDIKTSGFLLPGIYTAKLSTHYGKKNAKTELETQFLTLGSLPQPLALGFIIIIGIGVLSLFKLRRSNN